jgi:hypothetical protein
MPSSVKASTVNAFAMVVCTCVGYLRWGTCVWVPASRGCREEGGGAIAEFGVSTISACMYVCIATRCFQCADQTCTRPELMPPFVDASCRCCYRSARWVFYIVHAVICHEHVCIRREKPKVLYISRVVLRYPSNFSPVLLGQDTAIGISHVGSRMVLSRRLHFGAFLRVVLVRQSVVQVYHVCSTSLIHWRPMASRFEPLGRRVPLH